MIELLNQCVGELTLSFLHRLVKILTNLLLFGDVCEYTDTIVSKLMLYTSQYCAGHMSSVYRFNFVRSCEPQIPIVRICSRSSAEHRLRGAYTKDILTLFRLTNLIDILNRLSSSRRNLFRSSYHTSLHPPFALEGCWVGTWNLWFLYRVFVELLNKCPVQC